ncbi:MAG: hypothetical protein AB7O24_04390 [Kofleriaceae bacterium]
MTLKQRSTVEFLIARMEEIAERLQTARARGQEHAAKCPPEERQAFADIFAAGAAESESLEMRSILDYARTELRLAKEAA